MTEEELDAHAARIASGITMPGAKLYVEDIRFLLQERARLKAELDRVRADLLQRLGETSLSLDRMTTERNAVQWALDRLQADRAGAPLAHPAK